MCAEVADPDRIKVTSEEFKIKARRKLSIRQLMLLEKQKVKVYVPGITP